MSTSHKPKRDTAGRTHLHRACQRGAVVDVRAILEAGKEFLNAEDNAGYLPLHEACLWGHLEVVKILINNGAWLDVPSRMEQDTPLLDAVDNGHAEVVKYLLELGADPRKRNKQGQTALDANDSNRDTPEVFGEIQGLLKVAISKLRSKRSSDDEARASAAADSHSSSRDASVASPVHQSPPAPSAPTGTRRRNARTEQSRKDLLWLDAGKNGLQKLREKAREGDQQMVHALLERGTKPDTETLIGAIKGGHVDTVSLLLAYGDTIVDPEPGLRDGHRKMRDSSMPVGEETPMLAAIGRGNLIVLGYLLENGVNPRRLDSKGKSYIDIARDREGERWQEEVEMLKKAWEKAGRTSGGTTRRHSPVAHRNTSPKPKKVNDAKVSSRPRTNSSLSSATTARRSASANPSRYEDALAASDQEITAEPLGPPKNRGRKGKRNESDNLAPIAKKKRRLVSGKDLAKEESLARSSQEPSRSVPPETDIDSSEKKLVARKTRTNPEELRSEPKQSGRGLGVGSEDLKMSDLPTPTPVPERNTLKSRTDHDSNLLRPDNIPLKDRKLPTLGGKRDRTRSPTSHSDSGRRPDLDDPKRQRKMAEHKPDKYDSDSTVKRVPIKEEVPSKRKLHPGETAVRRDSPHARRPSLSADTLEREEERRRREKEELERQERRDRERRDRIREEDDKRRAQLEAEVKEQKRQNHLRAEMESIISKAQLNGVIDRELFIRKKREEQERIEREIREREEREQEEREERERARVEREVREREEREERERGIMEREIREREVREREEEAANRRIERQAVETRERETREREAKEREMREREAKEKEASEREAEQKRLELKHREEEERRHEEERRAEETRRRLEEEELQKRLAEEQRRKEEEAEAEKARHEALENQRRAAEAERKRKAAEEERKRQEFERAQREKETRDRRVAEQLQQQLAAERKRVEEELAEKRRSEEEEERRRDLARREALPFALRRAEENHANRIVLDERERERFLPLYSATFSGHSPLGNATPTKAVNGFGAKPQLWILNVQAALVLGIMDLEFSNCMLYPAASGWV